MTTRIKIAWSAIPVATQYKEIKHPIHYMPDVLFQENECISYNIFAFSRVCPQATTALISFAFVASIARNLMNSRLPGEKREKENDTDLLLYAMKSALFLPEFR